MPGRVGRLLTKERRLQSEAKVPRDKGRWFNPWPDDKLDRDEFEKLMRRSAIAWRLAKRGSIRVHG